MFVTCFAGMLHLDVCAGLRRGVMDEIGILQFDDLDRSDVAYCDGLITQSERFEGILDGCA